MKYSDNTTYHKNVPRLQLVVQKEFGSIPKSRQIISINTVNYRLSFENVSALPKF